MRHSFEMLDVVALTENIPERNLCRGQVGTIVEILEPDVFLVEFSNDEGQAYAMLSLQMEQVMALHYQLVKAA